MIARKVLLEKMPSSCPLLRLLALSMMLMVISRESAHQSCFAIELSTEFSSLLGMHHYDVIHDIIS
jgi:hypothetical protein